MFFYQELPDQRSLFMSVTGTYVMMDLVVI